MIPAALQSSAMLLAAFGALRLLRRQSAAVRHLILTAALFASIIAPLLPLVLPQGFHVVAGFSPRSIQVEEAIRAEVRNYTRVEVVRERSHSLVFSLWAAGAVVSFAVIVAGILRLVWLTGHSQVFDDSCFTGLLTIRRSIRLLQERHTILGTWGFLKPCILLPRGAEKWPEDRLRVILTQEVAHIERRDWPVQMAAELARAVYWFNPLFWFLCRRLRTESEHACDDVVLNSGINAPEYAGHLLDLARALRNSGRTWSPVLAMARPPHLERRFVAMLNPSLNRRPASRRAALFACGTALLAAVPLATVRAGEQAASTVTSTQIAPVSIVASAVTPVPKAVAKTPARKTAPRPAPVQGLADGSVSGTVTDATGAVIPGARAAILSRTVGQATVTETELQTLTTSEVGKYEFRGLTPGPYVLRVELPGFTVHRSGSLRVVSGQDLVENATLSVGRIDQTVEVSAAGQPRSRSVSGPQRIRVGGVVTAARLISQVKPIYPESAKDAGIEGVVRLQALIGTDGTLVGVSAMPSKDPDLTTAAVEAVKQWRYSPALLNNEPIPVLTTIDVAFRLAQ
jgi:TonB family protein